MDPIIQEASSFRCSANHERILIFPLNFINIWLLALFPTEGIDQSVLLSEVGVSGSGPLPLPPLISIVGLENTRRTYQNPESVVGLDDSF